jgi:hypothetical protein
VAVANRHMPEGCDAEDFLKSNPSQTELCSATQTSGRCGWKSSRTSSGSACMTTLSCWVVGGGGLVNLCRVFSFLDVAPEKTA